MCKADLATSMVMEMTALAGVMGRHYVLKKGDDPDVRKFVYCVILIVCITLLLQVLKT